MNDFVLSIILSEIEHQGWDNIYPPKFKECAVEIYQAVEKAGYCITPIVRTAKPKPTPTPSLGLLEFGEMRTDKRFTQSTLTDLQAKLDKMKVVLTDIKETVEELGLTIQADRLRWGVDQCHEKAFVALKELEAE